MFKSHPSHVSLHSTQLELSGAFALKGFSPPACQLRVAADLKLAGDFDEFKKWMEKAGFSHIARDDSSDRPERVWFILPEYPTYTTVDGFVHNYYYPE